MSKDTFDPVTAIASRQPAPGGMELLHQSDITRGEMLQRELERVTAEREKLLGIAESFLLAFGDFEQHPQGRGYCLNNTARCLFAEARALLAKIGPEKG